MKKMTPIYLIVSLIIFIIHMIMSIIGKIHIFHVIISPMLFTVTISVVYFSFRSAISRGDFSIIAGGTKCKDEKIEKEILIKKYRSFGIVGIICQMIFLASYFLEDKMPIIIVLLMTYATSMGVINVVVDRKVKKMRIDRM